MVLDLDETLVYSSSEALARPADLTVAGYHVYKRPYLDAFLDFAFATFKVGIWTSSGALYAEPLVAALMPDRKLEFVWSSRRCSIARDWETGEYILEKRLAKLKKRGFRLDEIIGIDDTPAKYAKNYGNLVLVTEFTGDVDDDELLALPVYLQTLSHHRRVRSIEKRNWRTRT